MKKVNHLLEHETKNVGCQALNIQTAHLPLGYGYAVQMRVAFESSQLRDSDFKPWSVMYSSNAMI